MRQWKVGARKKQVLFYGELPAAFWGSVRTWWVMPLNWKIKLWHWKSLVFTRGVAEWPNPKMAWSWQLISVESRAQILTTIRNRFVDAVFQILIFFMDNKSPLLPSDGSCEHVCFWQGLKSLLSPKDQAIEELVSSDTLNLGCSCCFDFWRSWSCWLRLSHSHKNRRTNRRFPGHAKAWCLVALLVLVQGQGQNRAKTHSSSRVSLARLWANHDVFKEVLDSCFISWRCFCPNELLKHAWQWLFRRGEVSMLCSGDL